MEEPQAQPMARLRREGVQVLNPHPESLAEITVEYPYLQERYEQFRAEMTERETASIGATCSWLCFARRKRTYEGEHRRAHRALAAALAGALHAQPGAGRTANWRARIFDITVAARSVVRRQLRLGSLGGRQPLSAPERRRPTS